MRKLLYIKAKIENGVVIPYNIEGLPEGEVEVLIFPPSSEGEGAELQSREFDFHKFKGILVDREEEDIESPALKV